MRNILLALTAALTMTLPMASALAAEGPNGEEGMPWFKQSFLDIREDIAEAKRANRRLMLYFYQDGCPYCARFLRETLGLRSIADKTRRHLDVVAIDLRGGREVTDLTGKTQTETAFAAAMNVKYTPTFVVFDDTGQVALRLTGHQPPPRFDAVLDYIVQGAYRQYPDFEIYLKVRAATPMLGNERFGLTK